ACSGLKMLKSTVKLFSANGKTVSPLATLHSGPGPDLYQLSISADGRWLASGHRDGSVRVWELNGSNIPGDSTLLRRHDNGVSTLAFSPDSRWLYTGSSDSVLFDLQRPRQTVEPSSFSSSPRRISQACVSEGRRWLATVDDAQRVALWDLSSRTPPQ